MQLLCFILMAFLLLSGTSNQDNRLMAIKMLSPSSALETRRMLLHEAKILQMLAHSNIVKLLGVVSCFLLHFIVSILVPKKKSRILLHEAKILQMLVLSNIVKLPGVVSRFHHFMASILVTEMLAHSNIVKLLGVVSRFHLHFIVSILVTQKKKSRMLLHKAKILQMLAHSIIVKLLGVVSRFHHFIVSILVTQEKI